MIYPRGMRDISARFGIAIWTVVLLLVLVDIIERFI
jgi:hypothetical protein